jgi:pyridoxamine 5'-phosphate oxidase
MNTHMKTLQTILAQFGEWFAEAELHEVNDHNAMSIATVNDSGIPSLRMVLLKSYTEQGFVFYTNLESQKGTELKSNPNIALNFYWKSLRKQIRITGVARQVEDAVADEYFATRPYDSKIGAHASKQSRQLDSYMSLVKDAALIGLKYRTEVPRPEYWSGFCVEPTSIEFFKFHTFKLHERHKFTKTVSADDMWTETLLYP